MKCIRLSNILLGSYDSVTAQEVFASTAQFAMTVKWSIQLRKTGVYSLIGDFGNAAAVADECVRMAEQAGIEKLKADSYLSFSELHSDVGDYEAVFSASKKALELYQRLGDANGQAWALNQLARAYGFKGDLERAGKEHIRAGRLFEKCNNLEGLAYTYNNLAIKFWRDGDLVSAQEYYEKAREIFDELGMKLQVALALNNIGTVYQRTGEYDMAERYFMDSLLVRQDAGDKRGIATCLNNLGMNDMMTGNYRQALARFNESYRIRADAGEIKEIGVILNNLAGAYSKLGNNAKAIQLYAEARRLKMRAGDDFSLALTDAHCALAAIEAGTFNEAEVMLDELERINGQLQNRDIASRISEIKRLLRLEQGMPVEEGFEQNIVQEITESEKNNIPVRVGALKVILGRSFLQKKQYPQARAALAGALEIFRKLRDRFNQGRALYYLGRVEIDSGDNDKAKNALLEALAIFGRIEAAGWVIRTTSMLQRFENGA